MANKRTPRAAPQLAPDDDEDGDALSAEKSAARLAADAEDAADELPQPVRPPPKPPKPPKPRKPAVSVAADDAEEAALFAEAAAPVALPPVKRSQGSPAGQRFVSLDDRKLTKKDRGRIAGWKAKDTGQLRDVVFAKQREIARAKFGHASVMMGSESQNLIIGIPTPALAFEYVIAQNCFPLGLVMQIVARHGTGKCLKKGTNVLRASGEIVAVEDVRPGDQLLGPDGRPRTVITTTTGRSELFEITPVKGRSWGCNAAHVLTLVRSGTNQVIDIPLEEFLRKSKTFQRRHLLFSVGVERYDRPDEVLRVDPYFLGVWFGDGTKRTYESARSEVRLGGIQVTKPNPEIHAACAETATVWGLRHTVEDDGMTNILVSDTYGDAKISRSNGGSRSGRTNGLLNAMRELVGPDITIPQAYVLAPREQRLQFLAGFLDTDGELSDNCFVISQKRKDWAYAIWRIARSLGLCATMTTRTSSCPRRDGTIFTGEYSVVTISGNTAEIPTRVPHKQATVRRQRKVATRTNFSVRPLGEGDYFGFTLDGDGRFLLEDHVVTHNSGFLAEIGRWFDAANGGMVLCENETKFNPHWYASIMGKQAYGRMQLHRCRSVEDWQKHLTEAVRAMQETMLGTKEEPGPGKVFPALFGVDSIMGKMSEENQEKILGKIGKKGERGTTGEGFAQSRSYPIEAGSITKYMRTIPQVLDTWPFGLVLINHLRMKQDDAGNPERNKTGGEQLNFQESFEIEIRKVGGHKKKIVSKDYEGTPVELSCEKNSFGPTHRRAKTRILWWHEADPVTGHPVQVSVWDWDWAAIDLLNGVLRTDAHGTYLKTRLKDSGFHLECPSTGEVDNTAWSKSLGMKASDACSWAEVGAMLREDQAWTDKIRDALVINRLPWLQGDYGDQLEEIAKDLP